MRRARKRWYGVGRRRTGGALVLAMALLVLSVALLAGSSAAGRSASRAATSLEAATLADAEARAVLAEFMGLWNGADDAMSPGMDLVTTIGPRQRGMGASAIVTRLRLHRLTQTRFSLAVDCQVGPDDAALGRRRLILLLERPLTSDTTAPVAPPTPIRRWSLSDLH